MGSRVARSVAVAGPLDASAARIPRRLGSARAAKTSSATASMSGRVGIEILDQLAQLVGPAVGVGFEGFAVAVLRELREARFDDGQPGATAGGRQGEFDVGVARIVVRQAIDAPCEPEDRGR